MNNSVSNLEPVSVVDIGNDQPFDEMDLPIHDDDYVPSNSKELAIAVKLLINDIENDDVEKTWNLIRKIGNEMTSKNRNIQESEYIVRGLVQGCLAEISDSDMGEPTPEELDAIEQKNSRKWGKKREPEAVYAMSASDADMLASIRSAAGIDQADADADAEEEEEQRKKKAKEDKRPGKYNTAGEDGATLDALAAVAGFSGPSGVKNLLYRIEDQVKYFSSLDEKWFKDLMEKLVSAYIEDLIDSLTTDEKGRKIGKADPDDVEFLLDLSERPDEVMVQPAFRQWSHDFLQKIYKKGKGKSAPTSYASKAMKTDNRADPKSKTSKVQKAKIPVKGPHK